VEHSGSRECDRYTTNPSENDWQKFKAEVRQRPPPLTVSLEGRRHRVADILEMGVSGSVSETKKVDWVTNIWKVSQQRDGSACGIYMLATVITLTRDWSLQDSTSAEQNWGRKARAWFLKVTLANTSRTPLGPCSRCGGVELNAVVRDGARMCLFCTYSTEVIDMDEEDQSPPHPRLPRREPSTRGLLSSEGASPDQGSGDCITIRLGFSPSAVEGTCILTRTEMGVTPETDRRGSVTGVTWGDLQPSPVVPGRSGAPLRSRDATNPLRTEVGLRETRGMVGERILGEEKESSGESSTLHLRNSKGPSGVLRETDEVGVHKNTTGGARRVVSTTEAPLGGADQRVSPRVCQNTTNVLGRYREASKLN
jgi:hypothetical protein